MPSAKVLEQKKVVVAELTERLNNSVAGIIVDYKGINVADDTVLRQELREAGVEYTVTKNTMIELAIKGTELEGIAVISRSVEGVIAGVTLKQTNENEFKVSLRTYPPLDASAICKTLGGGGHKGAAGASVKGNLEEVKAKVLSAVKQSLDNL